MRTRTGAAGMKTMRFRFESGGGISCDQQREARELADSLLLEGLESGAPVSMSQQDWKELRAQLRARWDSSLVDRRSGL
jgi:hypothetical protein